MSQANWMRWASWAGIAGIVCYVIGIALFLVGGQPPDPANGEQFAAYAQRNANVFVAIALAFSTGFTLGLVFGLGLRDLIRSAGERFAPLANLFLVANVAALAVAYVGSIFLMATGMEASGKPDIGALRALFDGVGAAYGPGGIFPIVLLLATGSAGIQRSGVLPRWTATVGWVATVLNVIAIPSAFGGSDPNVFYSAGGLAPVALGLLPLSIWVVCVAVAILRQPASAPERRALAAAMA
jgi:uncharacterized protein DUF4386